MKKLLATAILIIVIAGAGGAIYTLFIKSSPPPPKPATVKQPLLIRGAIPYWDQPAAVQSFADHAGQLNQLALFWYYINSDGQVTKYQYAQEDPSILTLAHQHHIKVFFTLTNLGEQSGETWDSSRVEKVIANDNSRAKHIDDIMSVLNRLPFDGVNIDYEQVAPSQRANFTTFINQLAARLHQQHKLLSLALHPVTDSQSQQRYSFQDVKALSKPADFMQLMAYDQHENDSDPGPIASNQWVSKALGYLKSRQVPMNKVLLGVPLYGYDWTKDSDSQAADVSYKSEQELMAKHHAELKWDEDAKASYFTYNQDGQTHEVWFEDARSVQADLRLAQQAGVGGISFWHLGEEDPGIWPEVKAVQ